MSTVTERRELDDELVAQTTVVRLDGDVDVEPELECPYCGGPLDDDGFCDFDGATALGGLPEPR